jgi:sensor histidine kinase YesM
MMESLMFLTAHMFMAYTLMYFVVPKFILRGKYPLAAIMVVVVVVLTALISALITDDIVMPVRKAYFPKFYVAANANYATFSLSFLAGLRGGITVGGMAAAIKLMKYWYVKEQRNLQLQKENVETQLQLLKAQVHPHFLFNTLNNVYAHTQYSSPIASGLVLGLSDMLRYILYECNQPLVPLSKEIKMIRDYVKLETVRYGNKPDINIDVEGYVDDYQIAPLLLLPLVENSFKHGASEMLENPWINMHIYFEKNIMHLKIMNGKAPSKGITKVGGIGLQNLTKRLQLLYEGKHSFSIIEDVDVFVVNLDIELQGQKVKVPAMALKYA